ncbi:1,3-beta-galactosyl-N-acetylhexosamine phosphorylase [Streptobacillus notomytis]|uniref:1,3-beta-galactosyl-N-acetylhexosamine phosphorylase n=1 Tax=Streptobacillus notomytis TaxID=1712031 RepID=UPI000936EC95|nr:1,3-beta-galactosyl-N-acetylhexosamine phosphorylase [Streptobacillus notomytis]
MSRVTLPIEKGCEDLVLELIKLWGADAIRNSDGTKLNEFFENLDVKVYSTYFPAREDQKWPRKNPEEIQHQALISERYTAFDNTLEIDPMAGYYKEQLEIDEKTTDYWQVFDRTTGNLVPKKDWKFNGNTVIIQNTKKFHEYTVNFFAKQTWDTTHMYNHMTNNWIGNKSIPYDAVFDKTREHIYAHLKKWCKKNTNVNVVRFTTFFYHFTIMYNQHAMQKFGDWFGYSASVSPKMFEKFKEDKGYDISLEDIIDQGYYNNQFRNPSKVFLDYIDFIQKFVSTLAKVCVDIVHEYGKEAIMFVGDNWIGTEPYGKYFKNIGLDGVAGSAECGVDIRMVSDMENIRIKEIRFLPYLFPDTFHSGNSPHLEWEYNWMRSRRAILTKKVDRIGFGGYLSLAAKFPLFIDSVTKSTREFREIHEKTANEECIKPNFKIGILNSWGKIKSWQSNRTGHATGNKENISYIGVLEALSGLPYNIEFINFDDIKNLDKLSEFKIIINVGEANTSFSGGENWLDEKVLTAIREFVSKGNGFIGIGDPSAAFGNGTYFQLQDVLGVDKEIGNTLQFSRYMEETKNRSIVFEQIQGKLSIGNRNKYIYSTSHNLEILQLNKEFGVEASINKYGKGKGVYLQGLPYSIENTRFIYNIIRYITDDVNKKYISDNIYVEAYEFNEYIAVINNSDKNIKTNITALGNIELERYELKWIKK